MPKSMFGTIRMRTKDAQAVAQALGRPDSGLKWLDDVNKDRFDLGEAEIVIDQNAAPYEEKPPRRVIPKTDKVTSDAPNPFQFPPSAVSAARKSMDTFVEAIVSAEKAFQCKVEDIETIESKSFTRAGTLPHERVFLTGDPPSSQRLEIPMPPVQVSLVAESGLTLAEIANQLPTLNEAVREFDISVDQSATVNTDTPSGEPVWMGIDYANQPDLSVRGPDHFIAYMTDGTTKTGGQAEYLELTGQSGSTAPMEQAVDAAATEFSADMAPAANQISEQVGLVSFIKTEPDGTLFLAYDSDLRQLKSARLALHMAVIRRRATIRDAEEDILLIREQLGWINRRIDRLSRKKP